MNEVIDLWPELNFEKIRSPKTVLKEQADLLSKKTGNILKGEIKSSQDKGFITVRFQIVASYLGGYRYDLMAIAYDHAKMYPVRIIADNQPWEASEEKYEATNESELVTILREIFNSPQSLMIINSLYSQSLEETENV